MSESKRKYYEFFEISEGYKFCEVKPERIEREVKNKEIKSKNKKEMLEIGKLSIKRLSTRHEMENPTSGYFATIMPASAEVEKARLLILEDLLKLDRLYFEKTMKYRFYALGCFEIDLEDIGISLDNPSIRRKVRYFLAYYTVKIKIGFDKFVRMYHPEELQEVVLSKRSKKNE